MHFTNLYDSQFAPENRKQKNSHFGGQAAIAYALGPVALRPCFSTGLPLSAESQLIFDAKKCLNFWNIYNIIISQRK